MDGDKRGMSDYNGEMRRGRGGGYRMPGSKDVAAGDMGHYGDKVCWQLAKEATRLRTLNILLRIVGFVVLQLCPFIITIS